MDTINQPTKLSIENYGKKVSVEFPRSDISASDMLEAFVTLMIGTGWFHKSILNVMKDYVEEHEELNKQEPINTAF